MIGMSKIITTILIAIGVLAIVNRVPQIRHLVKGETMTIAGKVVKDPRSEYESM